MEMWKIDKNFAPGNVQADGNVTRYALPCAPFDLYGVYYDAAEQRFARLPADVAAATSEGVVWLRTHTSGGRLRFATDSDYFEITVRYNILELYSHMPLSASAGFVLIDERRKAAPCSPARSARKRQIKKALPVRCCWQAARCGSIRCISPSTTR